MYYWFANSLAIPPVQAENLFEIGPIAVRNSTFFGFLVTSIIVVLLIWAGRSITMRPSKNKFIFILELGVDYFVNLMSEIMGSRSKAMKFSPLIISLFFVILINNWAGLLPGVGHSITATTAEGHVPFLRAFTSDLNNTLSLAILTMLMVQVYSIKELGGLGYLKHFFTDKPYNPVNIFVGLLEIVSECTKALSLSLRLFGNIFAGEVLLFVINSITGYLAPLATLPFIVMELFAGFIQAFVFAMLTIVYLSIATADHSHDEAHHSSNHSFDTHKPTVVSASE